MKNRRIVSVLTLLVISITFSFAQKITGIVYMVDEPVEGAKVILGENAKVIKTDHNGYFSTDVKGISEMKVSYQKVKSKLYVNELTGFIEVVLLPSEKKLARMIVSSASLAKCEAYLKTYPDGKKAEIIKETLEELRFIEAYDAAVGENNLKLMEKYLTDFPEGLYVEKAENTVDVVSWQHAKSIGTQEAYNNYLTRFPNGEAVKLAKEKVAMINK